MPKAPRASQSQGTYRTTPLVPQNLSSQNDRHRLRQLQAQNIAQQQVQRQQARAAQQQVQQQQQQLAYPSLDGIDNIDNMQCYTHTNGGSHMSYGHSMAPMPSSLYMSQPMPHQSLSQPMLPQPVTNTAPSHSAHVSSRPSSGAWSPQDDSQLMSARAGGQNWSQIQSAYFPSKTANACRKRHERLMEKRNNDDWDALKLEALGSNYMAMRKEIWGPLAEKCGEKWTNIEAKVLASGLKNLQSAARASQRRARLSSGGSAHSHDGNLDAHGSSSYTDDSALGEDVDEYGESPNTEYDYEEQTGYATQQHQRKHSQQIHYQTTQAPMMGGMGGQYIDRNGYAAGGMSMPQLMRHASHSHTNSMGSNMSNGGRDMGIQNIINRGV